MKYLNKNTLVSLALGLLLSVGLVYAANITTLLQTATPGDKVTSTWVNAVNTKLGTVDAAGATYFWCYVSTAGNTYASCTSWYTKVYSTKVYYTSLDATFESWYPPSLTTMYSLGGTLNLTIWINSAGTRSTVYINGTDIYLSNGIYGVTSSGYGGVALCCK